MYCISIQNREIGPRHPVFIIAEAGVNHNGDPKLAGDLVRAAKRSGADCVKFQTFSAERIVTQSSPKAAYQLVTTDPAQSQLEMLKQLELPEQAWSEIRDQCAREQIAFLSTPYSLEDVDLLDELGVHAFKIASGQATEPSFLRHVALKNKPILLSTGMCTLGEVERAVRTIREANNQQIVVLQCTTNYPSRIADANLRSMQTMSSALNVPIGYSDHTPTLTSAIVSVALGACVVERHFTLDKKMEGPDHACSSTPAEFKSLVKQLREAESCLGKGLKQPTETERGNLNGMRRSIVAKRLIRTGEVLAPEHLTLKRPATGLPDSMMTFLLDRIVLVDIPQDSPIDIAMVGQKV